MAALRLLRRRYTGGASGASGAPPSLRAWGAADQGALGLEEGLADIWEPEAVVGIEGSVRRVGAGHYHSFAITEEGELWSWGRAKELQLGRPPSEAGRPLCPRPGRVEGLPGEVVSATGSGVVSFAVTADGNLWAWGSSKRGQLGLGREVWEAGRPHRVAIPGRVVGVAAGWGHAAARTDDGRLFTWGWPAHGRLGHSFASSPEEDSDEGRLRERCVWKPREVELLRGVQVGQVDCGFDHSLVLASDGTLLSFGDNSLHQLGRPESGVAGSAPREGGEAWVVHAQNESGKPKKFRTVAAGLAHSLGVLQDGCVTAWGWNAAGQLGLGQFQTAESVAEPSCIYGIPHNRHALIAAGRVHSFLATDELLERGRQLLSMSHSWGSAANGRLGSGQLEDAPVPELIPDLEGELVRDCCSGLDHTLVLLS